MPSLLPRTTPDGDQDRRMMRRAIALARRGEGRVEPNPMVGCVIVRRGQVIGEGYHRRFGAPHAEVEALRAVNTSPRGATVYVSLEPCCHQGKTPPCSRALIEAGVARVVAAIRDPNRTVRGRGLRALRRAGVRVDTGVEAAEAAALIAPFATRIRLDRPYVIGKWAQSLDGKLAGARGESKWISCETSRRRVHRLRARVDAVLVGSGTVLSDDPALTARNVPLRRRALRVVLDGRLRIPLRCQLVDTTAKHPVLVFTLAAAARSTKASRLRKAGVEVVACGTRNGRLSLAACLSALASRDVTNLLVEGGAALLTSFLDAELLDEAYVFTAPILIGGAAPALLGNRVARRLATAKHPHRVTIRSSGIDVLHRMHFTQPPC